MSKSRKAFQSRQQIKDKQINYYLQGDVEKNLEGYRNGLELNEKQLSDAKKNTTFGKTKLR